MTYNKQYLILLAIFMNSCLQYDFGNEKEKQTIGCDLSSEQCLENNSDCYWLRPSGDSLSEYQPSQDELVIGVLLEPIGTHEQTSEDLSPAMNPSASGREGIGQGDIFSEATFGLESDYQENAEKGSLNPMSISSPEWPRALGLFSGLSVSYAEMTQQVLLVCQNHEEQSEQVLQTFRQHNVQVVIGEPPAEIPNNMVYITTENTLNPFQINSLQSPKPGWIDLRPDRSLSINALEVLSSALINELESNEVEFKGVVLHQGSANMNSLIEEFLYRVSPYQESNFRTLITYFSEFFRFTESLLEFLDDNVQVHFIFSTSPVDKLLTQYTDSALSDLYESIGLSTGTSGLPLIWLAPQWNVGQQLNTNHSAYWSNIQYYTVTHGEYAYLTEADEDYLRIKEGAERIIDQLGHELLLPTPGFGFGYDAGILAGIILKLSKSDNNPQSLLTSLTNSEAPVVLATPESLERFFAGDGQTMQLKGMSGPIDPAQQAESLGRGLAILCASSVGSAIKSVQLEVLTEPKAADSPLSNRVRIDVDPNLLEYCLE